MNAKNLTLASLAGGLVTVGLTNIPILNLLTCLICASFWIGPVLGVWLYRRLQGQVTLKQGLAIGALAGGIAGVIGFLLGFVNLAGVGDLPEALRGMGIVQGQDYEQMRALFAGPMVFLFNFIGALITAAFGLIGGLIGGAIFKSKPNEAGSSI
jgi:hypothetical protein